MKTTDDVNPLHVPAMARKKYTPATVEMKRLTVTPALSFTSPVNSQTVNPVTKAKRNIIAVGLRKHTTIVATKSTPVIVLAIKLFIIKPPFIPRGGFLLPSGHLTGDIEAFLYN